MQYKRPIIFQDGRWLVIKRKHRWYPYVIKHAHPPGTGYFPVNLGRCVAGCADRAPDRLVGFVSMLNWER